MYRNNACALPTLGGEWRWRAEFMAHPHQLEGDLGISYRSIIRARHILVDAKRLTYHPSANRSQGLYTLIPFAKNLGITEQEDISGRKILIYDYVHF